MSSPGYRAVAAIDIAYVTAAFVSKSSLLVNAESSSHVERVPGNIVTLTGYVVKVLIVTVRMIFRWYLWHLSTQSKSCQS